MLNPSGIPRKTLKAFNKTTMTASIFQKKFSTPLRGVNYQKKLNDQIIQMIK